MDISYARMDCFLVHKINRSIFVTDRIFVRRKWFFIAGQSALSPQCLLERSPGSIRPTCKLVILFYFCRPNCQTVFSELDYICLFVIFVDIKKQGIWAMKYLVTMSCITWAFWLFTFLLTKCVQAVALLITCTLAIQFFACKPVDASRTWCKPKNNDATVGQCILSFEANTQCNFYSIQFVYFFCYKLFFVFNTNNSRAPRWAPSLT